MLCFAAILLPPLGWGALLLLLAYPLQVARLAWRKWRSGASFSFALASAFFLMLGKLPQCSGVMLYRRTRASAKAPTIIEYKGAGQA